MDNKLRAKNIEVFDGRNWFPLVAILEERCDTERIEIVVAIDGSLEASLPVWGGTTLFYEPEHWRYA